MHANVGFLLSSAIINSQDDNDDKGDSGDDDLILSGFLKWPKYWRMLLKILENYHIHAMLLLLLLMMMMMRLAQLEKIRIGHDGSAPGAGWLLDEVKVDIPSKGECYTFACHRWLDKNEDDGQIEIEIEPTSVDKGAIRKLSNSHSGICGYFSAFSDELCYSIIVIEPFSLLFHFTNNRLR